MKIGWLARCLLGIAVVCGLPAQATVATHYFYWYRHPDLHMGGEGREGHFHDFVEPEAVRYDDPDWHRGEFRDMARAGIDVALPVYWGAPGAEDRPGLRFATRGLAPMCAALDAMRAAGEATMRLGMFYDTSTLHERVRGVGDERADLTTDAGRALFVDTVLGFFERIPKRHWARHPDPETGRPLVVLYTAGFAKAWDAKLGPVLAAGFAARFDGERPFLVADASWGDIGQDATTQWGAALHGPRLFDHVAQIGPGYDDSPVPGRRTPYRPREDGAFYRWSWRAAIESKPSLVLIETWNEMHEGTEICRTVQTGASYLDITRDMVDRLRRGDAGPEISIRNTAPLPRPDLSWGAEVAGAEGVSWRPGDDGARGLRPIEHEDGPLRRGPRGVIASCPADRPVTYLYLQVSDHWRFDVDEDLVLELAVAGGRCSVEYDSRNAEATLAGAYTHVPFKGASGPGFGEMGVTERLTFVLDSARLANRENGGADLRLIVPRGVTLELLNATLSLAK